MWANGHLAVVSVTFCGVAIAPTSHDLDYGSDPWGFWRERGLEFFLIGGQEDDDEYVGITLETCAEKFFDHTFEDIRGIVHAKLRESGIPRNYDDVKWTSRLAWE
jgi:hypothetical protein